MEVCVIGTGYVGLVAGTCLADMGNNVICVDKDEAKLEKLRAGVVPIYEPGLEELIKANVKKRRLSFSSSIEEAVKKSFICFIAVGTPCNDEGFADLEAVYSVAYEIAQAIDDYKIIVNKSTVPVGTAQKVEEIIKSVTDCDFDVVSNPEFLKQGAAVEDFLKPDRVIIGAKSERAAKVMCELYTPHTLNGNPVLVMDVKSAEMTKYASNSFLAMKISFMNEIANICEKVGADIQNVRQGMICDKRIGSKFLFPGLGFGGSCFPKDVRALFNTSKLSGYDAQILSSILHVNLKQRQNFVEKILKRFNQDLSGCTFGVWGLSFKPNTNDMREAPSITIINALLAAGASIKAYDPKAMEYAREIFGARIEYCSNLYSAINGVDALLLLTEWHEFRMPDFKKISEIMKRKIIFDGRNQYDFKIISEYGFEYYSVGRQECCPEAVLE